MASIDPLMNAFVTLMVMLDPPGNAPLFLALTVGMSQAERFQVALRGCITAFIILTIFAIAGSGILKMFGITIPAFRVAGGLLLFWIAFEMIFEKRQERREESAKRAVTKDQIRNIAAFPLAIPLIAGPGSISAIVLLSSTHPKPLERVGLIGVLLVVMIALFAALIVANRLDRLLGETGRAILTRLLGVLLAALSVQFVADGVKALATG
ncbi:MarC family protein [Hoeflea sp. TYP-13]|uniref:MarC family protein n=1 Tax=Hoeflea sp. TYP-13 TaxID=3230023 RepID=UPI0034C5D7C1